MIDVLIILTIAFGIFLLAVGVACTMAFYVLPRMVLRVDREFDRLEERDD